MKETKTNNNDLLPEEKVIKLLIEKNIIESKHDFNPFIFVIKETEDYFDVIIDGSFKIKKKMAETKKQERFEPIGRCYLAGRCDWWNPPLDMMLGGDFCIRCWKWKYKKEVTHNA